MTKKELMHALENYSDDDCVIGVDESGGWDNIQEVKRDGIKIVIIFGGGLPFTD